jgi:hypothetical protein
MLQYEKGKEMVLFLSPDNAWGLTYTVGMEQGAFTLFWDPKGRGSSTTSSAIEVSSNSLLPVSRSVREAYCASRDGSCGARDLNNPSMI